MNTNSLLKLSVVAGCVACLPIMPAKAEMQFQLLRSFGFPALSTGSTPYSQAILGADGWLYGTASKGGSNNLGVVFKVNPNGTGYQILHAFGGAPADGQMPMGELLRASDGSLYGTTFKGGTNDAGTVFAVATDGTGYRVLRHLDYADGVNPAGGLLEGRSDGLLYGTASYGGPTTVWGGTIFKLGKDGTGFTVLYNFNSASGAQPQSGLLEAADGKLYGTTITSGPYMNGTLFRLNRNGTSFEVLRSFVGNYGDGGWAQGRLVQGPDGYLYGTTKQGGNANPPPYTYLGAGTIYRISPTGAGAQQIYLFPSSGANGYFPAGGLCFGKDGNLYGTATKGGADGGGTIFKLTTNSWAFTLLHSLTATEGSGPQGALVTTPDGTIFGAAPYGGDHGSGTLFRVRPDGSNPGVVHAFAPVSGGDGTGPAAPLAISGTAAFGTTAGGGPSGLGVVFTVNLDGSGYTLLHAFTNGPTDGNTTAGVVRGPDGAWYGTLPQSGSNSRGAVFKLSSDGATYTLLHDFAGGPADGATPQATMLVGRDGLLYGTTAYGGVDEAGTVFRLKPDGSGYTVLHHFTGNADGGYPSSPLIQGSDGLLYGTAQGGGTSYNGTVFRLGTNGAGFTRLHDFGNPPDGAAPLAGLLQGQDGFLYGVTSQGGTAGFGTVFKLSTNGGALTVLRSFAGSGDVSYPQASVVQTPDGTLYGVANNGGTNDAGVVYGLRPDGSGYTYGHVFAGPDGASPIGALAVGPDGSLYGTAQTGAASGFGGIYRLYRAAPTITGIHYSPGNALLSFAGGASGQTYSILAASNLTGATWLPLGSSVADTNGNFHYTDTTAGGEPARFYRSYGP